MRIDPYNGQSVPSTLGEYRDIVFALVRDEENPAVKWLDKKIADSPKGRDEVVLAADSQMRAVLYPMMMQGFPKVTR